MLWYGTQRAYDTIMNGITRFGTYLALQLLYTRCVFPASSAIHCAEVMTEPRLLCPYLGTIYPTVFG